MKIKIACRTVDGDIRPHLIESDEVFPSYQEIQSLLAENGSEGITNFVYCEVGDE